MTHIGEDYYNDMRLGQYLHDLEEAERQWEWEHRYDDEDEDEEQDDEI